MVKPLLILAFLANTLILASSNGQSTAVATSSSSLSATATASSVSYVPVKHQNVRPRPGPPRRVYCRPNEEFSRCPIAVCRPKRCEDLGKPIPCPDIPRNGRCPVRAGCICREGLVRGSNGICIPYEKCSPCKRNEVYDLCPAPCPYRTCGNNDAAVSCAPALPYGHPKCPPPKCRCKDGFYRNNVGQCVTFEECPVCQGINEVYDPCPAPCPPQRCDVDPALVLCAPSPVIGDPECKPGCRCIDNYVRNDTGVCIPREQCPKCPKPNEVFDPCIASCPPRRCDVDDRLIRCSAPPKVGDPECVSGCRCADGFVRNYDGFCVTRDQCPKCTKPHEVYDPCPSACPPQTCESINKKYHCPYTKVFKGRFIETDHIIYTCDGACVCEPGYYRNKMGECISKENCLKCAGPNEHFTCGGACDNVCGLLQQENQTNCPIQNVKCNDKCYCDAGYARDQNNICIPIEHCKVPQCGWNERYESCPDYLCEPMKCSQLGFPLNCRNTTGMKCPGKPGCVCKNGYIRDDRTGYCIPKSQCPSCGGDKNAKFGCGVHCNQLCSDIGNKHPKICTAICKFNACDCKKGYYFNERTKKCVLPKDCSPQCGANEYYNECANGDCNPQTCDQLGFPIACPDLSQNQCQGACLCNSGYVRNCDGICVPTNECPSCGGDPNAVSGCGVNCNKQCTDLGKPPGGCILICYPNACDCREGFYYDANIGRCVPPKECPKVVCGPNEVFNNCTNAICGPKTCNELGYGIGECPNVDSGSCTVGCVCEEGYLRNDQGVCIPTESCPSCGGDPNAVSGCGINCNRRCSDIGKKPGACILLCILNACDCREGYYFDENTKKCVLPEQCTPQCGANEYYNECANGNCSPQTCDQLGFPIDCPDLSQDQCQGACLCNSGYVRNCDGICVPAKECPSCGGDSNAVSGCGVYCDQRCTDIGNPPRPCIRICYPNACDCKKGYYLDADTNTCVLPEECPNLVCGPNEVLNNCTNAICGPQSCNELGYPIGECSNVDSGSCTVGCVCEQGYLRNDQGVCIPTESCPSCGGDPNAVSGCGIYCNRRCSDVGKKPGACIALCILNACDCKEGYYFDENIKLCVPPEQCTPTCPENEFYSECTIANCSPENCTQVGFPIACPRIDPAYCKKGCLCKSGYARDCNGVCIPIKQCPSCGGDPNAEGGGSGLNCGRLCSNYNKGPVPCPLILGINGCDCREGYVFDSNIGKCVLPKECTPVCSKNEVYSECINGGCQAKNCSQLGLPVPCIKINPKYCIKGCLCKEGYLRADNGICVPENECQPKCTGQNEVYDPCPFNCPPQTCESLGRLYVCPIQPDELNNCKGACRCKEGFYRNKIGDCISEENCLRCPGPNEFFSCGGACDNVCKDLSIQNQTSCPIINIKCNDMCYCEKDYARAENNTCIPIDQCNEPQCPINERYDPCPSKLSEPQSCSQLGYPIGAPQCECGCPGGPGCVCMDGYVRNDKGVCIPKTQCPSCGGDPNAESGSGVNCNKRCEDLGKDDVACIDIYYENSCDCRDGYYFDSTKNKCVLPEECSICPKNEVYDPCTNGGCDFRNCSQIGGPKICIDPIRCKTGCKCKQDYLRSKSGKCIPIEQCPEAKCGKNQKFDKCPLGLCRPQRCDQIGFPISCPAVDGDYCPGEPGCVCVDGYVKNKKGRCVPLRQCPSCGGDENAQSGCGVNCGKLCDNVYNITRPCPRICKVNACDCKDGFYLDEFKGKCVPADQCPPPCPENEVIDSCANGGCGIWNCSQFGGPILCIDPIQCESGCRCKQSYLRDDASGACVPEEKCPGICQGQNEEYDKCPPTCPPQTCEAINQKYFCPKTPLPGEECQSQCRCKENFFRNKIGECISKKQCLKCQGPHEYFSCGPACDNVCSKLPEDTKENCSIKNVKCVPKCYCEDGYARNDSDICIPINECPDKSSSSCLPVNETTALAYYENGNEFLTGEMIYQLVDARPGESFMISATSVLIALAQLTLYAVGSTLEQLLRVLNLRCKEEIRVIFPTIIKNYQDQLQVTLSVAVKNYANINVPLSDMYLQESKDIFGAEAENIDFSKNYEAAAIINKWVEDHTNNLIKNLISPDALSADTRTVLVNALYFLGNWKYQFNPNNTTPRDFYISETETITIPTMYQQKRFLYAENDELDCQILSMFYKGDNFTFTVFLPRQKTGLKDLVQKLRDPYVFDESLSKLEYQNVKVWLPRMDFTTSIDVKEILIKANVTEPFTNSNEFKGILKNDEPLVLSEIVQKSALIVDETGTEAAVATAILVSATAALADPPKIYSFDMDHSAPFYLSLNGQVLMSGVFAGK